MRKLTAWARAHPTQHPARARGQGPVNELVVSPALPSIAHHGHNMTAEAQWHSGEGAHRCHQAWRRDTQGERGTLRETEVHGGSHGFICPGALTERITEQPSEASPLTHSPSCEQSHRGPSSGPSGANSKDSTRTACNPKCFSGKLENSQAKGGVCFTRVFYLAQCSQPSIVDASTLQRCGERVLFPLSSR